METKQTKSAETKVKYLRAFWPLILNAIALLVYIVSVKFFYSGLMQHRFLSFLAILAVPCIAGCMFFFPGIALLQLIYSLYLRFIKKSQYWYSCHLTSAVGVGLCYVIFHLLLKMGYYMTV